MRDPNWFFSALAQVTPVLRGGACYADLDDLGARAIVWAGQMKQKREELDLEAEFAAEGRPYAELGENGQPVVRWSVGTEEADHTG